MTALTSVPAADVRSELKGRITAYTAAPIWRSALQTLAGNPDRPIIVDASQVEYADGVGIAFLFDLIRRDRPGTAPAAVLAGGAVRANRSARTTSTSRGSTCDCQARGATAGVPGCSSARLRKCARRDPR